MALQEAPSQKNRREAAVQLDPALHRRVLSFLNEAIQPQDLMFEKLPPPNPEMDHTHEDQEDHLERRAVDRRRILELDIAKEIIEFRDQEFPLGFRNVKELFALQAFTRGHLETLLQAFSNSFYGSWSVFPQAIPRRGPGGYDGVVHAAMLHTGKVLFITADETTLLWNPNDTTPATFEDPLNQPHLTPDAALGYSVLCGGHTFLSEGSCWLSGAAATDPMPRPSRATSSVRPPGDGREPPAAWSTTAGTRRC
jgi:hypothetical protein